MEENKKEIEIIEDKDREKKLQLMRTKIFEKLDKLVFEIEDKYFRNLSYYECFAIINILMLHNQKVYLLQSLKQDFEKK